jgi:hypothetical protein
MLPRALLRAHSFQFFSDFGRVLVLPLKGNKQRLLLGKLAFAAAPRRAEAGKPIRPPYSLTRLSAAAV